MKSIIIDVETTGLDDKTCAIIELAAMVVYKKKKISTFEVRMHPFEGANITFKIGDDSRRVSQAEGYRMFIEFLDKYINKYNKEDKFHFIAYNAPFDTGFIREMFLRNKNNFFGSYFYAPSICMMQVAAVNFMKNNIRSNIKSMKLMDVAASAGISVKHEKLHTALYDVELTHKLFCKLIKLKR